jgi:outer membrane protein OmpA-like peptidoglycan-associated protein
VRYSQILIVWLLLWLSAAAAESVVAAEKVAAAETAAAPGIQIEADLTDAWQFVSDGGDCRLEQELDSYGVARFLGVRGHSLKFELIGHRDLFSDGPVDVYQRTPQWHPDHPDQQLLGQALHVAGGGIAASDPVATRILLGLFEGYDISLSRQAWFAQDQQVGVKLTSVGLREGYPTFTRCFKGPLLRSWAEVERTRIGFPPAIWALDDAARQRLDELAAYLSRDPSVAEVFIDGHTDDSGSSRANLELARQRARTTADYLVSAGVPQEKLVVRYHGGRYPVADNSSEIGRAENRRVTIRLERNWSSLVSR